MATASLLPWERSDDRTPLSMRIAATTARTIIEQGFDPDRLLTEADLAEAAGVSRTPAREAMLQLERWGLVRLLPKKGATITTITPRERRELLELRVMLEVNAVEGLAERTEARESLQEDCVAILDRQRLSVDNADFLTFASTDYALHARIIGSSDNSVVASLLETLGPRFARLTYTVSAPNPQRLALLYQEHARLLELAADADTSGFVARLRDHIDHAHFQTS